MRAVLSIFNFFFGFDKFKERQLKISCTDTRNEVQKNYQNKRDNRIFVRLTPKQIKHVRSSDNEITAEYCSREEMTSLIKKNNQ